MRILLRLNITLTELCLRCYEREVRMREGRLREDICSGDLGPGLALHGGNSHHRKVRRGTFGIHLKKKTKDYRNIL